MRLYKAVSSLASCRQLETGSTLVPTLVPWAVRGRTTSFSNDQWPDLILSQSADTTDVSAYCMSWVAVVASFDEAA